MHEDRSMMNVTFTWKLTVSSFSPIEDKVEKVVEDFVEDFHNFDDDFSMLSLMLTFPVILNEGAIFFPLNELRELSSSIEDIYFSSLEVNESDERGKTHEVRNCWRAPNAISVFTNGRTDVFFILMRNFSLKSLRFYSKSEKEKKRWFFSPFPSDVLFVVELVGKFDIVVIAPRSVRSFSGRIRLRISSKRRSHIFGRDVLENSLQPNRSISMSIKKKIKAKIALLDGTQYGGLAKAGGPKPRIFPAETRT